MNSQNSLGSGPRHLAAGRVGPVTVEPDDAPLHAPTAADHPAILDDGVVDPPPATVRHERATAAKSTGDRAFGPRPRRDLVDAIEADDGELGIPEPAFLAGESALDFPERGRLVARRQCRVIARSAHV